MELIVALATDPDQRVRCGVAGNPSAPDSLLRELAKDSEWNVRSMVDWNGSTPTDLLDVLSSDPEFMVRDSANESIASRPTTPAQRLRAMSADRGLSESVRCAIGKNPNAPAELQRRVAMHDSPYMRVYVAGNPAAEGEVLLRLGDDVDQSVALHRDRQPLTSNRRPHQVHPTRRPGRPKRSSR